MVLTKRRTAKKREKAVNVSLLFTVRHVFVGFVEGGNLESGIRNPESGIRNPESGMRNEEFANLSMSPVGAYCIVLYFLY